MVVLLETSFWSPAFIVAAAWSDMEARLGEAGGESPAAGNVGSAIVSDVLILALSLGGGVVMLVALSNGCCEKRQRGDFFFYPHSYVCRQ